MSEAPLPYTPDVEKIEEGEAEIAAKLGDLMLSISQQTFKDTGHGMRGVHAKGHALLTGNLIVLANLPPHLAQGIFAKPGTYETVMRFSTSPGDILPDSVSTPRGLALKVMGVEGERLPGSEDATTQDFLMVNGPAFLAPNAKNFLSSLKPLAATTDKMEAAKEVVSAVLRGTEKVIEAVGGKSGKIRSLGGEPATNALGETYFTQVPLRYGAYMCKVSVAPVSPDLNALKDQPLDIAHDKDALRSAIREHFATHGGEWEIRVQLCTNLKEMPIEDASVAWPEDKSSYIAVARLSVPPQETWNDARSTPVDDSLSFNPWHGITAHRPLGSVMRVRKSVYELVSNFRRTRNGCPMHEPKNLEALVGMLDAAE